MGGSRALVVAGLTALSLLPAAAQARDAVVTSFDGTPIVTHFFPAKGLAPGERAPTLMMGPGWGVPSEKDPDGGTIGPYVAAGYNVITWDPRGFHESGGTVMVDHRHFEGRDARKLIDFVASQPEALLDRPGDPRIGMNGPSYGGGIQLVTAATDPRVDAIAPTIAWNSLPRSLFHHGAVKSGWGLLLSGVGVPASTLPGVVSRAGIQTGHLPPEIYRALVQGASTGEVDDSLIRWFADRSTGPLVPRIKAPTLIVQGTVDTLFTPEEAHRTLQALQARGTPARMMWFCGGHGVCLTGNDGGDLEQGLSGEAGLVLRRKMQWFARHLKRQRVATGPRFEWIDEDGRWHSSAGYPLRRVGQARGRGSGRLVLKPGANPGSGVLIYATPDPQSLRLPVRGPAAGAHLVGEPRLEATYRATGISQIPGRTYAYAQLVDQKRNVVVNNLATPIPISLDGKPHSVELPLERIASRATNAGYRLELTAQTSVYDIQRAGGTVDFDSIEVALPVTEPVRAAQAEEDADRNGGRDAADATDDRNGGTGDQPSAGPPAGARTTGTAARELPFSGFPLLPLLLTGASLVIGGGALRRLAR